jgi:RNA-directed DNA polymerase
MERHVLFSTDAGTPQGGIISPVLANLALDGLEMTLREAFPQTKQGNSPLVHFVRFADDFIVSGRSQELLEHEVKPLIERFLRERGLSLSPEKTSLTHIEDGFDFLGQNVRKYNGKMIIKPSKKSVHALLTKVREIIKVNKSIPAGQLVLRLNPLIRGWVQYHRHVVSKATFSAIDHAVFQAVWRWARRRHPTKSAR